jgi:adenosylcobinamide kinase/adenosylcobinamide-phosphate guanylyltransferase
MEIIFVVGGCRSGKSSFALQTAEKLPGNRKIYIATCVPKDHEMKQRIARHREERGQHWVTVEEPLHLPEAIINNSPKADVLLVDCLTLWVSNLFMETDDNKSLQKMISPLTAALKAATCPMLLVSNEVGTGIVPENQLARQYRDMIGWTNQVVAKTANRVVWMVAGIPVTIKTDQATMGES